MKVKKWFILCLCVLSMAVLSGCGGESGKGSGSAYDVKIDIDLTAMSNTVVYSEVYNMVMDPDSFIGKTVKMAGVLSFYRLGSNGICYACVVDDATACCQQGIEFELAGTDKDDPEAYPELGEKITLVGVMDTYEDEDYIYCVLRDAVLL